MSEALFLVARMVRADLSALSPAQAGRCCMSPYRPSGLLALSEGRIRVKRCIETGCGAEFTTSSPVRDRYDGCREKHKRVVIARGIAKVKAKRRLRRLSGLVDSRSRAGASDLRRAAPGERGPDAVLRHDLYIG